jgi:hypothetical protein
MFSGNEWIWFIIMLAIVMVAAIAASTRRQRPPITQGALVRGTPAEMAQEIVAEYRNRRGVSVHAWTDGIILLERRTFSGWSMAVAILAFPVGLLALITRNVDAGTIMVSDAGDGKTRVQFRGWFDPRDIARINDLIDRRSSPVGPPGALTPGGSRPG